MTNRSAVEHSHVVGVYDHGDELIVAIVAFLGAAFAGGGTAVAISTAEHRAALDVALAAQGVALDAMERAGRYRALDADDMLHTFMRGDRPDPVKFASVIGGVVDDAERTGSPVYLFGEMVGLLWDRGSLAAAIELESLWNDLAREHTFALFCAYAMSSLETSGDLAAAKLMCDRHSRVIPLDHGAKRGTVSVGAVSDAYDRLFLAAPDAVPSVREFVRRVLGIWGDEPVDSEAEVIASELATNAVKHAESPFRVSIARSRSTLRIAVRDTSFARPEQMIADFDRAGGRGIQLVSALSRAWGTELESDGKTVWAEVARH